MNVTSEWQFKFNLFVDCFLDVASISVFTMSLETLFKPTLPNPRI